MNKLKNYLKELHNEGVIHSEVQSQILHLVEHTLYEEMSRAFMYGKSIADMMDDDSNVDLREDYAKWRMTAINKQV